MNTGYFKVKAKVKKGPPKELKGIGLIIISFLLLYCLLLPLTFGEVGKLIKEILFKGFGVASYFLPLALFAYGVQILRAKKVTAIEAVISVITFVLLCGAFSILGLLKRSNYGGYTGIFIKNFFVKAFGEIGAGVVLGVILIYLVSVILKVSILELLKGFISRISRDMKEWRSAIDLSRKMPSSFKRQQEFPKKPTLLAPEKKKDVKQPVEQVIQKTTPKPVIKDIIPSEKSEKVVKPLKPDYSVYKLPTVDLLKTGDLMDEEYKQEELLSKASLLEDTLKSFNVNASVIDTIPGPTITRFDLSPAAGVKVQQITALENDIALAMKTTSIRMITPVPGKAAIGIEIPNRRGKLVGLRDVVASEEFSDSGSKLTVGLGKTTDGKPCIADIIPMPHLLIAGATGSGKSVCIHSIITSVLFKARPDEVKFLLIDPKRLELPLYNGLPHLYDPRVSDRNVGVITRAEDAANSLKQLVTVMEKRYEKFAKATVRNIDGYNEYAARNALEKEFYILVIIDELADLILIKQKEVEDAIQRLAQMARAVGIHLLLATQRPSVDVITGVIKANLSCRIAFQVLSKTDSRVILDTQGAEDLLGSGDMLYLATGEPKPVRLQGSYVSEKEIEAVINFIKKQGFKPYYEEISSKIKEEEKNKEESEKGKEDQDYIIKALDFILERKAVSQDLMKAIFKTSSRGSYVLNLLAVKGFIFKPEGTNKWSINFAEVEKYLREVKTKS
ncbi:MAG: DNA translocase FtsK 4TM domain-containing protein [Elusimicrobiota bacterium]